LDEAQKTQFVWNAVVGPLEVVEVTQSTRLVTLNTCKNAVTKFQFTHSWIAESTEAAVSGFRVLAASKLTLFCSFSCCWENV